MVSHILFQTAYVKAEELRIFLGNWGRILSRYGECWRNYYGKFGVFMLGLFSGYYVLCGGDPEF